MLWEKVPTDPFQPLSTNPFRSSGPIGGTSFAAWFNYLKGMMGAGLLAIPHGYSQSGLILGLIGFMVVGVVCAFSVYLLVEV